MKLPAIGDIVWRHHSYLKIRPDNVVEGMDGILIGKVLEVFEDGTITLEVTGPKATPPVIQHNVTPLSLDNLTGWFIPSGAIKYGGSIIVPIIE